MKQCTDGIMQVVMAPIEHYVHCVSVPIYTRFMQVDALLYIYVLAHSFLHTGRVTRCCSAEGSKMTAM